jgi:hypothetical protein
MKALIKKITKTRRDLNASLKTLEKMEKLAATPPAGPRTRGIAAPAMIQPADGSKREQVIAQLIGLLHSEGVNAPSLGPSSVYGDFPIGFSPLRMLAYCQTCRRWFRCKGLADEKPTISVGKMATKIIAAGGNPR